MLRDYQIDICSRVSEAFDKHRSVMVQMPTGTGKTIVLASLVIQILNNERIKGRSGRILIVAHRRELIEQIKATNGIECQQSFIINQKSNHHC